MSTQSYVAMLQESLIKKVNLLEQIIEINEKQRDVILDVNSLPEELDSTIEEKGFLIEELDTLDEGFTEVFDRVKRELEKNRALYSGEIQDMKDNIRKISELSARIELQEARNNDLATQKFSDIRQQIKKLTQNHKAVNKYYNSMQRSGYMDPQFMDNKK